MINKALYINKSNLNAETVYTPEYFLQIFCLNKFTDQFRFGVIKTINKALFTNKSNLNAEMVYTPE